MKVKVLIEFDIPCIDKMTVEDGEVIKLTMLNSVPTAFEFEDGGAMLADSFSVEILE